MQKLSNSVTVFMAFISLTVPIEGWWNTPKPADTPFLVSLLPLKVQNKITPLLTPRVKNYACIVKNIAITALTVKAVELSFHALLKIGLTKLDEKQRESGDFDNERAKIINELEILDKKNGTHKAKTIKILHARTLEKSQKIFTPTERPVNLLPYAYDCFERFCINKLSGGYAAGVLDHDTIVFGLDYMRDTPAIQEMVRYHEYSHLLHDSNKHLFLYNIIEIIAKTLLPSQEKIIDMLNLPIKHLLYKNRHKQREIVADELAIQHALETTDPEAYLNSFINFFEKLDVAGLEKSGVLYPFSKMFYDWEHPLNHERADRAKGALAEYKKKQSAEPQFFRGVRRQAPKITLDDKQLFRFAFIGGNSINGAMAQTQIKTA